MSYTPPDGRSVLIVDDNAFNRGGIALYLHTLGYSLAEAGDEAGAMSEAIHRRPWAAVVDIVIPPTADAQALLSQSVGLRLVRELKQLDPAMGIVIFSAHEDRGGEVWDLVRDGIRGIAYLLKGARPELLLQALHDTAAGRVVLDGISPAGRPRLAEEIRERLSAEERPWVDMAVALLPDLTDREREVALRLANSQNTIGIAAALNISIKTVENHISRVYDKLGLSGVDSRAPNLRKSVLLAKAWMLHELGNDRVAP